MLRLLRLIDTCLSSCLLIAVGWGHWLTNFCIDLDLRENSDFNQLFLPSPSSSQGRGGWNVARPGLLSEAQGARSRRWAWLCWVPAPWQAASRGLLLEGAEVPLGNARLDETSTVQAQNFAGWAGRCLPCCFSPFAFFEWNSELDYLNRVRAGPVWRRVGKMEWGNVSSISSFLCLMKIFSLFVQDLLVRVLPCS